MQHDMTIQDAFIAVAEYASIHLGAACDVDPALEIVMQYARVHEGVQFPGDDVLGDVDIKKGDKVVFIPLDALPGRPILGTPIAGEIDHVMFAGDVHDKTACPDGYPYRVRLDDAVRSDKRTLLWAKREELQPVAAEA